MKRDTLADTIHHWNQLESQLVFALQHFKDGAEAGNLPERMDEIHRHIREAKSCFDWLDNFAIVRAAD